MARSRWESLYTAEKHEIAPAQMALPGAGTERGLSMQDHISCWLEPDVVSWTGRASVRRGIWIHAPMPNRIFMVIAEPRVVVHAGAACGTASQIPAHRFSRGGSGARGAQCLAVDSSALQTVAVRYFANASVTADIRQLTVRPQRNIGRRAVGKINVRFAPRTCAPCLLRIGDGTSKSAGSQLPSADAHRQRLARHDANRWRAIGSHRVRTRVVDGE